MIDKLTKKVVTVSTANGKTSVTGVLVGDGIGDGNGQFSVTDEKRRITFHRFEVREISNGKIRVCFNQW